MEMQWVSANYSGVIPPPTFGHTAVQISKTKLILFGGATGSAKQYNTTNDLYLYNMFKATWMTVKGNLQKCHSYW
jgi:hypothetical protein